MFRQIDSVIKKDNATMPDTSSKLRNRFIGERRIKLVGRQVCPKRPADLYGLYRPTRPGAADSINEVADCDAKRKFE